MLRVQRLPCCGPSCPEGGRQRHTPPRNVLPCERAAFPQGAKHPLGCSIAKRGWHCSVNAGQASRGGLLAEQGRVAGPVRCHTPNACVGATRRPHGAGLWLRGAARHAAPPCWPREWQGENSWGVTTSAFRLSSTCVCESTPLFFCETGCTRPPTGMVIKRETFI